MSHVALSLLNVKISDLLHLEINIRGMKKVFYASDTCRFYITREYSRTSLQRLLLDRIFWPL